MSEISEASIPALKTNALSTNAWNENEKSVNFSSSSSSTNGRIVNIDKNLVGKTLNIRVGQSGSSYCWNAVVLYDENDIEIDRVETACNGTKEKNIIITEQMKKIHFNCFLQRHNCINKILNISYIFFSLVS